MHRATAVFQKVAFYTEERLTRFKQVVASLR